MRALTLKRPWLYAILRLGKHVENRTWRPPRDLVGRWFLLHEGKGWDADGAEWIERVCGVVCDQNPERGLVAAVKLQQVCGPLDAASYLPDDQGHWYMPPQWGWLLSQVVPLRSPVPMPGARGLWRVPAPLDLDVLRRLPDPDSMGFLR